jgi:hypothetical protein
LRRSTLICCRRTSISASSRALDRNKLVSALLSSMRPSTIAISITRFAPARQPDRVFDKDSRSPPKRHRTQTMRRGLLYVRPRAVHTKTTGEKQPVSLRAEIDLGNAARVHCRSADQPAWRQPTFCSGVTSIEPPIIGPYLAALRAEAVSLQ